MRIATVAVTTVVFATTAFAQTGRIVAMGDEWLLSDQAFIDQPAQTQQLANNIAGYFAGATGNFLVLSTSPAVGSVTGQRGVLGTSLAANMAASGHGWVVNPPGALTLATLQNYDAVFFSGTLGSGAANASMLAQYVNGGGSVLVMAGTGDFGGAQAEADGWNPFLNQFGLGFGSNWFGLGASLLPVPTLPTAHPLGSLVSSAEWGYGQTALDLNPSDPLNEVALFGNFTGFGSPPDGDVAATPIVATYNVLIPGPGAGALLVLGTLCVGRRREV